jgi:hypothetical protein
MKGMRVPRLRFVVTALLVLAGLGAGVQLVCAQTLADVARKEEERRKTIREPAKVYTNKDLTAPPPGSPQPVPATNGEPAKADTKGDAKGDAKDDKAQDGKGPAKDQAYWSARMKALQTTLDRDSLAAEAMQTRVNSLITDFINRDDPAQKAVIARNRDLAMAELTRLKQAVVTETKAIADFQEEARRAGVPPGWLR